MKKITLQQFLFSSRRDNISPMCHMEYAIAQDLHASFSQRIKIQPVGCCMGWI